MKRIIISVILILTSLSTLGQFSKQNIETDSSKIEIIKNSLYYIYEETYNNKDSVWYSVHFIKDTTKLKTEGWTTKNDKRLGIWKEYNFDGQLMYTRDYDNATCEINENLYPFHDLLKKMKLKADSLIISTYSKEFFEKHVRFDFDCSTYDKDGYTYIGNWTEPMNRKPERFHFSYQVKLNTSEWYDDMIRIELDEKEIHIPKEGIYGFDKVNSGNKTFQIDKDKAIEIAKSKGLQTNDLSTVSGFLKWEKSKNLKLFYNGQFKYYITEFTDEVKDIKKERSRIIYKYNVYSFNPWTGEFIEKKKMKRVREWEENSGFTSDLLPDE
ncbi:hypothetical protein NU10_09575 [Flavobacterium dauae]|uniref:hypothetical protein n=1 Tax=Flavobacterium dauae TaxID=1563479 RepID=UPI00101B2A70|nr:hypothetical protein [Flavobacterium dauae]WLD22968.1 hypothetical protein NU10_09575 [Flavobacterium dauae]